METRLLKEKLQHDIRTADQELLEKINAIVENFERQKELDKMIEEGEEDIRSGRVSTLVEVRKPFEAERK